MLAGFALLLLGISVVLMLCGSMMFFIGLMLMPWVLKLVRRQRLWLYNSSTTKMLVALENGGCGQSGLGECRGGSGSASAGGRKNDVVAGGSVTNWGGSGDCYGWR